ncbi:MAG: DUF3261 domain-containing protein [Spirochaetia bacterium]|nr:DUF3261 domain-containing protein [Spirochaetia bacterium]
MRLLTLVNIILFLGCSVNKSAVQSVYITQDQKYSIANPRDLGVEITAAQSFTGNYQDKVFSFHCHLEIDSTQLTVIGLSAIGNKIFTLKQTDKNIEFDMGPMVRTPFRPEYFLMDFQLTYLPLSVLESIFDNTEIRFEEIKNTGLTRNIYDKEELIVKIKYEGQDKWNSNLRFENLKRNYSFTIEPAEVKIKNI